jgi:hypothetical protein
MQSMVLCILFAMPIYDNDSNYQHYYTLRPHNYHDWRVLPSSLRLDRRWMEIGM